jgi:drug/metabolite transporter (DMT)-like permease
MIEPWIPITLLAATIQAARTTLQKQLKGTLGTHAITFVRYFYGLPFVLLYLALVARVTGADLPAVNPRFLAGCLLAGLAQIAATSLLIHLFSYRNFAVGTTYSKTDVVQTAIIGVALFGESLGVLASVGIVVSLAGVVAISTGRGRTGFAGLLAGWTDRTALIGIASGLGFAFAALFIRWGSLSLDAGFEIRGAMTLACMTAMQVVMLGAYIVVYERGEVRPILRSWRSSGMVGLLSAAGSAAWFTALTLQVAAYVRALGQVELILSLLISYLFFRERSTVAELIGMATIVVGIVLLVL